MGTESGRRERAAGFVRRITRYLVAATAGAVGVASLYVANALPGRSSSSGSAGASDDHAPPATASPTPGTDSFGQAPPAPVAPSPGAAIPSQPTTRTHGS